jgi:hypothetical protein
MCSSNERVLVESFKNISDAQEYLNNILEMNEIINFSQSEFYTDSNDIEMYWVTYTLHIKRRVSNV